MGHGGRGLVQDGGRDHDGLECSCEELARYAPSLGGAMAAV